MSDEPTLKSLDLPTSADSETPVLVSAETSVLQEPAAVNGTKAVGGEEIVMNDAPDEAAASSAANEEPADAKTPEATSSAINDETDTKKDTALNSLPGDGDDSAITTTGAQADELPDPSSSTSKTGPRRKSIGVPEHKKKLNKKASKAKITHTDAKPGDYFYARLKGYPPWPVIICDEDMLPQTLIKTRPVTAARENGEYRDDYKDGGAKVKDRTFPVMYLHTNEFGWIPNQDLQDLDFATVGNVQSKMRKDLQEAHKLAAEQHGLEYFKDVLQNFMEQRRADLQAQQEAKEAKAAKLAKSKEKKAKSSKIVPGDDEDVEMEDPESEDTASVPKKRKAEDDSNPGDSSKKIKLNFKVAPKTPNGNSTPKATKDTPSNGSIKPKAKKATPKVNETPEAVVPKEPELSAEEKYKKKEKEILFLRHKLQKGLLSRDQAPKEEEMKQMSEFISKLEGYSQLEVSIIRATKINKVLKNIIKLPSIPKEEDFKFKSRSQVLLDKWNKLLASEQTTPSATSAPAAATNGASDSKVEADEAKPSPIESSNGAQEAVKTEENFSDDKAAAEADSVSEVKKETAGPVEETQQPLPEKSSEASIPAANVE